MIAALFVQKNGSYWNDPAIDAWDETRDARKYEGPHPVVAHPPCNLWVAFAYLNFKRWGGDHNRPGNDGGCFASALRSVQQWGGVLEHPAFSHAWEAHGLARPPKYGWLQHDWYWVCEVWQSAYGHRARKRTWLLYCGDKPPEMRWDRSPGTHQIGRFDVIKPVLAGKAASATPPEFRTALISLALHA